MRKKLEIPVALGLILVVFFINITVHLAARLEEPVFLSHYYSVPMEDWISLEFSYIANRDEEKVIHSVRLPEVGDTEGDPWGSTREEFGVYSLYRTSIEFYFPEDMLDADLIFTEMEITWQDGTQTTADIGEVHLYEDAAGNSVLQVTGSGTDSEGRAYTKWQTQEDVEILGVTHYGENRFSDVIKLVGEEDKPQEFPVSLEAGDFFWMDDYFDIPQGDYRRQEVVGIRPLLQVKETDGSIRYVPMEEAVEHSPNLGFRQIYRILKMKGAI